MPIEIGIWRIDGGPVRRVSAARLETEKRLEDVLAENLSILGLGPLLVLDRQVATAYGTFIDILAIDGDGVVYVIELKRDKTPRDIVAQALDYGSWVTRLGAEQIAAIFEQGHSQEKSIFEDTFRTAFGTDLPDTINDSHRLIIVASELDASTERIVDYLVSGFGVPVNAVFFAYFRDGDAEYLARSWLRDPTEAELHGAISSKRTQQPWNGTDFYVSFGEGERRNWDDARKYGFISAGGGTWYSQSLRGLEPGHRIFVYLPGKGYVGVGRVMEAVQPVHDFSVELDNGRTVPVLEAPLAAPNAGKGASDPDQAEHYVRVEWIKTLPREQAYLEPGLFANQNSACRLRDRTTLEKLYERFDQQAAPPPEPSLASVHT